MERALPLPPVAKARLYLITPPHFTPPHFTLPLFAAELEAALMSGSVAYVQLRLKQSSDAQIAEAVAVLHPICQAHHVPLILNDRPDLAQALGCDGAHIGQSDMAYAKARRLLGADKIIGVTCHASPTLAEQAGKEGADYVAFGAFYQSRTKPDASPASLDVLRAWQKTALLYSPSAPFCVAIGGITPSNAKPLLEAGADYLAVSDSVWAHPQGAAGAIAAFAEHLSHPM